MVFLTSSMPTSGEYNWQTNHIIFSERGDFFKEGSLACQTIAIIFPLFLCNITMHV